MLKFAKYLYHNTWIGKGIIDSLLFWNCIIITEHISLMMRPS